MKKRGWSLVAVLAVLAILIAAPIVYLSRSSPKDDPVKIATSTNAWCTLTLVALDIGLFEKHGLITEVTYNAAGRMNMDALLSGSANVANIVEMNIANAAKAGERDLLIVGSIVRSTDYAVVSRSRGAEAAPERVGGDFSYLRGRSIGFAPGTGAEPFLFALLQKHRIREDEVKLVPIPPTGLVDQFQAGSVDVAVSWEPFVNTMKERTKGAVMIHRDPEAFQGIMTVAVMRKWANDNPETLERLIKVYQEAQRFVELNPERAQAIVARQAELPPQLVKSMWSRYDPKFRTADDADRASVQAAINVISRSRKASQTDVDFRTYFKR